MCIKLYTLKCNKWALSYLWKKSTASKSLVEVVFIITNPCVNFLDKKHNSVLLQAARFDKMNNKCSSHHLFLVPLICQQVCVQLIFCFLHKRCLALNVIFLKVNKIRWNNGCEIWTKFRIKGPFITSFKRLYSVLSNPSLQIINIYYVSYTVLTFTEFIILHKRKTYTRWLKKPAKTITSLCHKDML